ncbi:cytochrome b-c1 complex subunit 2, mitochondrial-like isoform X1 [Biomphalaria glabrata]|uniref:Cytochrome b-c1 complex subunit 2, mitochondrial-like isoform X1 n=1 Tax=Biomphalaria glabrata TaxID=6526 RepID=A0A9U8E0T0_BIOGL|nr:cytochrome b-c1 complex subunit 2, mitochondrial-like isoform X1 [Biomphalaria glabrata]
MATGLARPLARSLKGRMFGTAAAAKPKNADEREPLGFVKKLENGLVVGTIESKSPIARIAVVANAGSRFETGQNLGVSHVLRHLPKLRTENLSSLGIIRRSLQLGSDITSQGNREYIYYKSAVTRNVVAPIVEILQELTTKSKIVDWEFEDLINDPNGLKLDLALLKTQPQIRAVEALHAAAFRNTLGNSLYSPEFQLGKFTSEQVAQYLKTYFSAGRLALIGVGVDQQVLEDLGRTFEPYKAAGAPSQQAVYAGGEIRENSGGDLAYVAVAFSGPSQVSSDLLPAEVLKHVLGAGPYIKYSLGTTSALGKAAAKATDGPFAVSGFTANYFDAGLFGFTAVAPSQSIDKVLRAAAKEVKSLLTSGVSDAQVNAAKNRLKAEICMNFENPENILSWLGEQSLHSNSIITPHEVYKMVDNISTADVNKVAKAIAGSKPSIGVTGNTSNVPYLDKLFS